MIEDHFVLRRKHRGRSNKLNNVHNVIGVKVCPMILDNNGVSNINYPRRLCVSQGLRLINLLAAGQTGMADNFLLHPLNVIPICARVCVCMCVCCV